MRNRDGSDKGRVNVTFLKFEVEGSNPTIQEGLRNIAAAIERANGGAVKVVHSGAPLSRELTSKSTPTKPLDQPQMTFDGMDSEADAVISEPVQNELDSSEASSGPKQKGPRKYQTPKILDIDCSSGKPSLRDFAEQTQPKTDNDKCLIVATWLKEYSREKTETITIDHIYTCYRFMNWKCPRDVGQPLRKLKGINLLNGNGAGGYSLNHIGYDRVRQMQSK